MNIKENYLEKVKIEKGVAFEMENLLEQEVIDDSYGRKENAVFNRSFSFEDGTELTIQVCVGANNAWVDSFWHDKNGKFISESDPEFTLLGEYTLETEKANYSLILEADIA